jgi:hypothetical protein
MSPVSHPKSIWFPEWANVLASLRLKDLERTAYRQAIGSYLRFCKQSRQRTTVASARQFMQQIEAQRRSSRSQLDTWKQALNWFFQAGARRPASASRREEVFMAKVPPPAATDLGGSEWERKLIQQLRTRHYQWRTEQALLSHEDVMTTQIYTHVMHKPGLGVRSPLDT